MKDSFCKDLDVMKLHLNEINKIPLLSNEKEVELRETRLHAICWFLQTCALLSM